MHIHSEEDLSSIKMNYKLIDINQLLPHEEINDDNFIKIREDILLKHKIERAVIIDKHSNTILDGHHRYNAIKDLNLKLIPVIEVDYLSDESITLKYFRDEYSHLDKKSVISIAQSKLILPHKTTKHIHNIDNTCNVSLEELK